MDFKVCHTFHSLLYPSQTHPVKGITHLSLDSHQLWGGRGSEILKGSLGVKVDIRFLLLLGQIITNLESLSNTHLVSYISVGQKSRLTWLVSLLRVSQGQNQSVSQLGFYWEALGENLPPGSIRLLAKLSSL